MWLRLSIFVLCHLILLRCLAQVPDSSHILEQVRITAYEGNRKTRDVPAAVSSLQPTDINRFNPVSLVQAVSSLPGVKLEERSPGSYRLNIRGSALRSPFGVRNVKLYYNDLPLTDAGGSGYLNQLGTFNIHHLEIIREPGSSIYGAGTGGVALLESLSYGLPSGIELGYTAGSFGSDQEHISLTTSNEKQVSRLLYQHQQSDGYRDQSSLQRDVLSLNNLTHVGNSFLKTSILYSDLQYQTPGALTLAEYKANPKAARPGAAAAHASIRQKTFLLGASYDQPVYRGIRNKTMLYGTVTHLTNPNLRAYENSSLPHWGARTTFKAGTKVGASAFDFNLGGEWQQGTGKIRVSKNTNGKADSLRTYDQIINRQSFVFAQVSWSLRNAWLVEAGGSINWSAIRFQRLQPVAAEALHRSFGVQAAPRLSIMHKWKSLNAYLSLSKGFSPPATAELLPSGSAVNFELDAEQGINYGLGVKGDLSSRMNYDLNFYYFRLRNTIVQRRDALGGDYFLNAGSTSQKGIELMMRYQTSKNVSHTEGRNEIWLNAALQSYHYKEFSQVNTDYSGNKMPGVSPYNISAGVEQRLIANLWTSINVSAAAHSPLNDANSVFADAYQLVGINFRYSFPFLKAWDLRLQLGADNLLNEKYSLGNDLNGFGGRYYNVAPGRNYFAGLRVNWNKPSKS